MTMIEVIDQDDERDESLDAARYQWLRLQPPHVIKKLNLLSPSEFDQSVDDAMKLRDAKAALERTR